MIPVLLENPHLVDALKIPDIKSNIMNLVNNPQLSQILSQLSNNPDLLQKTLSVISN